METATGGFDSMAEVRRKNAAIGHHWFEPGTLRFFDATIGRTLYGGRMFGHSVRFRDDAPRLYRVAVARDGGEIVQVAHDWDSAQSRDAYLRRQPRKLEVRFDPYNPEQVEADADPDHFHWRVFMDGLPLDCRGSLADCRELVGEITATA